MYAFQQIPAGAIGQRIRLLIERLWVRFPCRKSKYFILCPDTVIVVYEVENNTIAKFILCLDTVVFHIYYILNIILFTIEFKIVLRLHYF